MQNSQAFNFGTNTPQTSLFVTTTQGGGLFQTPASSIPTSSILGTSTNANQNFGTTTTTFGATPTSIPSFGATPTSIPSFGATLGASGGFGTPSTATPTFGIANPTTAGLTSLNTLGTSQQPAVLGQNLPFGVTSTATPNFGFGATTVSTTGVPNASLSFNLGANLTSTPITTAKTSQGLGGQPSTQTKVVTAQKDTTPKDQLLPNEILQTVEAFKELVKQQKLHSSEIARCSVRDFRKVEQDINQLTQLLAEVESQLQKNRQLAEKLKYDTAKCLKDVEIAQRTQDTPPGLQYENVAPMHFFLSLADKFEKEMQALKVQIEGADNYVKNYRSPNALTPQDLHLGMRRLHESFVALAGRLHSVHNQVESQKEIYLNTRKQLFNDNTNPFEALHSPTEENFRNLTNHLPKVATGPTPFSNLAMGVTQPLVSHQQQNQSGISYPTSSTSATCFTNMGFMPSSGIRFRPPLATENALFGGGGNTIQTADVNAFQLQKPPTGNKRGKQ